MPGASGPAPILRSFRTVFISATTRRPHSLWCDVAGQGSPPQDPQRSSSGAVRTLGGSRVAAGPPSIMQGRGLPPTQALLELCVQARQHDKSLAGASPLILVAQPSSSS
jgi:hypothetical protein